MQKKSADWAFKSAPVRTDLTCPPGQPDKNQSVELACSWWSFCSPVDFYHAMVSVAVAALLPSWRSKVTRGQMWGLGQESRLNTLLGISRLWGRWRKSSLVNVSLNHPPGHTQTHTDTLTEACTRTSHLLFFCWPTCADTKTWHGECSDKPIPVCNKSEEEDHVWLRHCLGGGVPHRDENGSKQKQRRQAVMMF